MNPYEQLSARALPPLRPCEEIKALLQREVYGYLPDVPYTLTVSEPTDVDLRYMCGTVHHTYVLLTVTVGTRSHTFRVDRLLHTDGKRRPTVLLNNIHPMVSSQYVAIEEMSEYDADLLVYCYKDITSDDGDFTTGIAPMLLPDGRTSPTAPGKIALWAWASMRVLDYALTLPGTDPSNVAIAGHSRLGKTAAYTAMMDERFRFCFSNAAGCAGDTLYRGNSGHGRVARDYGRGELIEDLIHTFPYWFCENYARHAQTNVPEEFDQHFLIAAIAPRYVMIGSCDQDRWADPLSQQLCALAAGEAWERLGHRGYAASDRFLTAGESSLDGHVGLVFVHSNHFLSRHSWRAFMQFIEAHRYDGA